MPPDEVHNSVYQRSLFQQRHRLLDTVANVSGVHCTGKLVFRNDVGEHTGVDFFFRSKGDNLFLLFVKVYRFLLFVRSSL